MTTTPALPTLSFSLSDYAPEDRVEIWQDFSAGSFNLDLSDCEKDALYADVRAYDLGQAYLGLYSHSKIRMQARHDRSSLGENEMLVLGMHKSGGARGLINGTRFEMAPSFLTLYDANRPLELESSSVEYLDFMFPYSAVGYDPSRHANFTNFSLDTPSGLLLSKNLGMLAEQIPDMGSSDIRQLTDGFLGLLRGIVHGSLREETTQAQFTAGREAAIRRYIEQNLTNSDLTTDMICSTIGVSRAVLYRVFHEDGGVRRYIQRKRLQGARNDLAISEPTRGVIRVVASKWTFHDQAHFSRLYREEFGETPSEIIGSALFQSDEKLLVSPANKNRPAFRPPAFTLSRNRHIQKSA